MFFIKNAYATVWHVDDIKEKYAKVRIGTSEKNQHGEYENSNWFATFVGKAKEKVEALEPKDRITIVSGKVSNISKKMEDGKYKTYLNVVVFDFEKQGEQHANNDDLPPVVEEDTDEFPF